MHENAKLQTADQTLKGAIIGLITYIGWKFHWDMELVSLAIPVVAGSMAWLTTKFGNKKTACMFVDKNEHNKTVHD